MPPDEHGDDGAIEPADAQPPALPPAPAESIAVNETSPAAVWLVAVRGASGEFVLTRPVNTVGRHDACDVVLPASAVSRHHCRLERRDTGWWLCQDTPRNGTMVNGRPLASEECRPLLDGDIIGIGAKIELQLVIPRPSAFAQVRMSTGGWSETGARRRNEDSFHAGADVLAVADGVGSRPAGDLASQTCIDVIVANTTDLDRAVLLANQAVRARGALSPADSGLASTIDAAAMLDIGGVSWVHGVHVGDGYAMLFEHQELVVLTRPHTMAAQLVAAGELSTAEGARHPDRGRLTRAVGLANEVRIDTWQRPAEAGQRFVLCTDGLPGALGLKAIEDALWDLRDAGPEEAARELVARALAADASPDNVTVVVGDVVASRTPGDYETQPGPAAA